MKRILITGAGGFIGSHLTELCVSRGYKVRAFVRYNGRNHWGWLESSAVLNKIEVVAGDVRDYDSVQSAMRGCDTVFHLAALIGIPYSYVSPLAYVKTNIEGTYNVLQAGKELGIKNILITSTSEIYGSAQYVPMDEKHPAHAQSPYAASKVAADQMALSYQRSFGMPVKIARPFNVYGPRQSARAVIPTIITQLLSGVKTIDLGALTPLRDFTYVHDTVNGLMAVATSSRTVGEEINISSQAEISIQDLFYKIRDQIGSKATIAVDRKRVRPDSGEVKRLLGANAKLKSLTGWESTVSMDNGLKETIAWFTRKENISKYKMEIYNV